MTPEKMQEFSIIGQRKSIGIPITDDEAVALAELQVELAREERFARLARSFQTRAKELLEFIPAQHRHTVRLPSVPSARTDRLIFAPQHVGTSDDDVRGIPYVAAIIQDTARLEYALAEGSAVGFISDDLWRRLQDGLTQSARASAFIAGGNDISCFYEVFSPTPRPGPGFSQFATFLAELVRNSSDDLASLYAAWLHGINKSDNAFAQRHSLALHKACMDRSPIIDLYAATPWQPKVKSTARGATAQET